MAVVFMRFCTPNSAFYASKKPCLTLVTPRVRSAESARKKSETADGGNRPARERFLFPDAPESFFWKVVVKSGGTGLRDSAEKH